MFNQDSRKELNDSPSYSIHFKQLLDQLELLEFIHMKLGLLRVFGGRISIELHREWNTLELYTVFMFPWWCNNDVEVDYRFLHIRGIVSRIKFVWMGFTWMEGDNLWMFRYHHGWKFSLGDDHEVNSSVLWMKSCFSLSPFSDFQYSFFNDCERRATNYQL